MGSTPILYSDLVGDTVKQTGLKSIQQIALAPGASNVVNTSGTTTPPPPAQPGTSMFSTISQLGGTGLQAYSALNQGKLTANQTTQMANQTKTNQQQQKDQLSANAATQQQQLNTNLSKADNAQEAAWTDYQTTSQYNAAHIQNDTGLLTNYQNQVKALQGRIDESEATVSCFMPGTPEYKQASIQLQNDQLSLAQVKSQAFSIQDDIDKTKASTSQSYNTYSKAYDEYSSAFDQANPASSTPSNGSSGNTNNGSSSISNLPNGANTTDLKSALQSNGAVFTDDNNYYYPDNFIPGTLVPKTYSLQDLQNTSIDAPAPVKVTQASFNPDGSGYDFNELNMANPAPEGQMASYSATQTPWSSGSAASSDAAAATNISSGLGSFATDGITIAGSGYGLFASVSSMLNGNVSTSGIIGAAASFGGLIAGMSMFSSFLGGSSAIASALYYNPIFGQLFQFMFAYPLISAAIVAAIIVLIALLTRKPDAEEQALATGAQQLSVWDTTVKPLVLSATAAAALFAMGNGIDQPMSSLSAAGISVPTSNLTAALQGGLTNADGSAYAGTSLPYNTPLIIKGGAAGGGDSVIFLGDGGVQNGVQMEKVYHYDTDTNMAVTAPCNNSAQGCTGLYVPIFNTDGSLNSEAFNVQSNMLSSASGLTGTSAQTAVHIAAAANKQNTTVTPVP